MTKRLDGYVRVSRTGGRAGPGFIAPDVQRKRIAEWAAGNDVEVIRWWEELDQSGATVERPKFKQVRERIARGETEGIIVADRSRFARSLPDALQVIQELDRAGATFAAADGFDSSTPEGRLGIHIMLSFAQFYLDQIRISWRAASDSAVRDGVHIAPPPLGYKRSGRRKPLEVDEDAARLVRELFKRRATGESTRTLAKWAHEQGVQISSSGIRALLRNDCYLGVARGPYGAKNETAHPPLITEAQFEAAQGPGVTHPHTGAHSSVAVLTGLVKCAGCGRSARVFTSGPSKVDKDGSKRVYYGCTYERCTDRGAMRVRQLDDYVEGVIQDAALAGNPYVVAALEGDDRHRRASEAVAEARRELESFVTVASAVNPDLFKAGLEARQGRLDAARRALAELGPAPDAEPRQAPTWEQADLDARRASARRFIAKVILTGTRGKRGKALPPIEDRVRVIFTGEEE